MNTTAKMIIVLTVITGLSGGILSMWNSYTEPYIEQNRLKVLKKAISTVLPDYDHYDEIVKNDIAFYVGKDSKQKPIGIAFKAKGNGFSPDLTIMVGVDTKFSKITGIEILEHTETPGLGNKIEELWFKDQFIGLIMDRKIPSVVKNKKPPDPTLGIQAISGATISSQAVVNIVYNEIKYARDLYHKNTTVN